MVYTVVDRELRMRKHLSPLILAFRAVALKVLFQRLVHPLSLTVGLRVECCAELVLHTRFICEVALVLTGEHRSSVGNDSL
jgi:hypothetical protein